MPNKIEELAQLGVLLLMFYIGMEVQLGELARVGNVGLLAGVGGSLLTVAFSAMSALYFGYTWQLALFAGVALAATSVSISAQVLLELGLLRTTVGSALLAAALIDDIVAILLVSVVVPVITHGGGIDPWSLAGIVSRIGAYLRRPGQSHHLVSAAAPAELDPQAAIHRRILWRAGVGAGRGVALWLVGGLLRRRGGNHGRLYCWESHPHR